MKLFKKRVKVDNIEDTNRLPVVQHEPVFREKLPSDRHLEDIRDAKEYLFQNTATIRRVDN